MLYFHTLMFARWRCVRTVCAHAHGQQHISSTCWPCVRTVYSTNLPLPLHCRTSIDTEGQTCLHFLQRGQQCPLRPWSETSRPRPQPSRPRLRPSKIGLETSQDRDRSRDFNIPASKDLESKAKNMVTWPRGLHLCRLVCLKTANHCKSQISNINEIE